MREKATTTEKKTANVQNLVIRPVDVDEFFKDSNGQQHRGIMVAFDPEGNEVARGTTYAEFMADLRKAEI